MKRLAPLALAAALACRTAAPMPEPGPAPASATPASAAVRQACTEAAALMGEGSFEQARERLAALGAEAGHPEALQMRGVTFAAQGDWSAAAAAYREALAADPTFATAHYNLACALARQGKPAEALAALQSAVEKGMTDPRVLDADDDLASLRAAPEFARLRALAERLRFQRR